jgi:glyoxylase I family protein
VIFKQGIPITAFEVDDLLAEYDRFKGSGVMFTMQPRELIAIFSDTRGNLIQT